MSIVYQGRLGTRLTCPRTLRVWAPVWCARAHAHSSHSALEAAHHLRKERVVIVFKEATLCGSHGCGARERKRIKLGRGAVFSQKERALSWTRFKKENAASAWIGNLRRFSCRVNTSALANLAHA